ncbi:hypothetical protein CYMTET_11728 [Cymbomonas tetramitiformis]|uniref:PH domain-containing protein n=1 Tax=Cymbomonas tetramitiformis TaxID=36881 RepID=A0AAE0GN43_9CHLO|nr:hypothetical protein CYMTET_11728 [Cymbomonas tetramitiformis]
MRSRVVQASCKSPKVGCWKKGKVAKQLVRRWIQFDDGKLLQWSDDAQDSAAKKTMISEVATVDIYLISDFPHSPSQVCQVRFANKKKTQKRGVFMEEKDVQAWADILSKQALVRTHGVLLMPADPDAIPDDEEPDVASSYNLL